MSTPVSCSNCERPAKYRGLRLCARCYQRLRAHGDLDTHQRGRQPCCMPACEAPVKAYGYCERHWQRVERHGSPEDRKWSRRGSDRCVVPGCGGEHRSMGLCDKHYSREQRNGHPLWRTVLRLKINGDRPWQEDTVVDPTRLTPSQER